MFKNIILVTLRNFVRKPSHTFINIIGLAVGFTCGFLTLIWVSNELSFDKFHHEPGNIYKIMTNSEANGDVTTFDAASVSMDLTSVPEVQDRVVISSGTRWPHESCFRPDENTVDCVYMNGIYASKTFFSVFDFPILEGDQHPLDQPASIAMSAKMAKQLYKNENPIGKTIKIDGHFPVVISAVFQDVPSNSSLQFEFVMPIAVFKAMRGMNDDSFNEQFLSTYIRTQSPVAPSVLNEKLNDDRVLSEKLKRDHLSYMAYAFTDWRLKSKFENGKNAGGRIEYVTIFLVVALLVMLLSVINFVNLSTARATTRAKEIGIRKVTGAHRASIMLQFFSESFLIVLIAFGLAAIITNLTLPGFSSLLIEPITVTLLSGWMPVYLLGTLVLVAVCAGIYPAFVMSSFQPLKVLKNRIGGTNGSQQLRKILLTVQLTGSIGILIFSGVIYFQMDFIIQKNLGFDRNNMIQLEPTYQMLKKFDVFKEELLKNPTIESVGTSSGNPLDLQSQNTGVQWPGKPDDVQINFQTFGCSYELPETMGLKLVEGRFFESAPRDTVNQEVIVTEDAVNVMGMANPIGEVIRIGETPCVIVGVVNNFHSQSLRQARLPIVMFRSLYTNTSGIYIKYKAGTTQESIEAISKVYKSNEPAFTMKYWFLDELFDKQYKTERVALRLVLLFTAIALISAMVGIVGMATFNVLRRVKEIGIRRVFGATIVQIMNQLTREFVILMVIAFGLAAPMAWYATSNWLSGFAYHVAMPWWFYVACFGGIASLTVAIICIQGFKTIVTNPTETLRSE